MLFFFSYFAWTGSQAVYFFRFLESTFKIVNKNWTWLLSTFTFPIHLSLSVIPCDNLSYKFLKFYISCFFPIYIKCEQQILGHPSSHDLHASPSLIILHGFVIPLKGSFGRVEEACGVALANNSPLWKMD